MKEIVAIENTQLLEASQRTVRQMEALLELAQLVTQSLELEAVLDAVLAGLQDVVAYQTASILLPQPSDGRLALVAVANAPLRDVPETAVAAVTSVPEQVFATGQPFQVPEAAAPSGHGAVPAVPHAELAVPLKRGNTVIGVLEVERRRSEGFRQEEIELLELFAAHAAIAIENARLYEAEQRRADELLTVQRIVERLAPLHELEQIADVIEQELSALLASHTCLLWVLDGTDLVQVGIPQAPPAAGTGFAAQIAAAGEAALIADTLPDERAGPPEGTAPRSESLLGAPLVVEERVLGVITLSKLGRGRFDRHALRLLEIIAGQAALSVDRARMYAQLRREAITDELTGVYNRRYLAERAREERARAIRNGHPLVTMVLDLDAFKMVNDRHGHVAGDAVLCEVGRRLRRILRTEDVVARVGGEEFCLLVPELSLGEAELVAERVRETLGAELPVEAGVPSVTVSIGLAQLDGSEDVVDLFRRADVAMYAAKRRGGDGIAFWAPDGQIRVRGEEERVLAARA